MAICGPAMVPHSHFLGGPLVWTELDREKQRWWHRQQAEKCGVCGLHPSLTDPELGGHPDALELTSVLCRTCEISERGAEDYQKDRMPGEHQVWTRQQSDSGPSAGGAAVLPPHVDGSGDREQPAHEQH